jgi:hypothetical protein
MECQLGRLYRKSLFLGRVRKTSLNQHAGYRSFFPEAPRIIFGKVRSPAVVKTPFRAAQAACGTV